MSSGGVVSKQRQAVVELQMELFAIESALSEYEQKKKDIKARLAKLGAGTKVCTKCETEMDIEQFYRDKQKRDKRCSWCVECVTAAVRAREARHKDAA